MAEKPIVETTEEARAGETRKGVRYVLAAGLVLVIIGFIIAYLANMPTG